MTPDIAVHDRTTPRGATHVVPHSDFRCVQHSPNRSQTMHLMHEDLARAHHHARSQEAQRAARHHRLVVALRAQRRAEAAALRARRLLAAASDW